MLSSPVWRGFPQYAFALGLVGGGVASASALVTVGSLVRWIAPPTVWTWVLLAWFVVIAARELGLVAFRLPQNARLVPESVFRHGPFWGPLEFGLEMGTGVRTYVTSGLPYVVAPAVFFLASWQAALVAGLGFGLGRAVMTISSLRYAESGEWDAAFDAHGRVLRPLLLVAFGAALVVAGGAVAG